jgi:NRAMP (natural resistance-associated macrophage protein)-like metal ion transporter
MEKFFTNKFSLKTRSWFGSLGPGLITGASDDDPSGIATYSQAGAQTGFGLLWTIVLSFPLMVAIQLVSAKIGRVTGIGIAGNMKKYYPKWIMVSLIFLMLGANIINIGADIAAMGEAANLVIGGNAILYSIILTVIGILLQVFIPYSRYVFFLKWLCLVLFAYVAVVFSVHVPWVEAIKNSFLPTITFNTAYLTTIIAVLGTTISPYLFFWQASEEVEDEEDDPDTHSLISSPEEAPKQLARIKKDTFIGMAFSNLIAFFIILSTAVTLHMHGKTDIDTAAQAAEALRPIAGEFTFLLFAIGIIGTGLLALPVLAGSAAYAISEMFGLPMGLQKRARDAKRFYGLIAGITLAGMLLIFIGVNPIKALFWAAVINGIVAVPIMILMMFMGSNKKVMGDFTLTRKTKIFGWIATGVMFLAAAGLLFTL